MKIESIISFYDRESIEATEFRRLYANILSKGDDAIKSVMVTSSITEEGKSTIASFLAMATGETAEKKVLLLDTDLRRPMINVFFKLPLEKGFAEILEKKCSIKDAIKKTPMAGLSIITAGKATQDPTSLITKTRLSEVFKELEFYFDFIIIDAPPIIPVSDPLLIANETGGTLLVVRAGMTPQEVVKRASNFLKNSNISILGVVLNNLEEVLPYYYGSKYYGSSYYNTSHKKK